MQIFGMRDRMVATALMLALIPVHAVPAYADEFPSKRIRLIVPFAPGGPSDIAAREIAEALRSVLGPGIDWEIPRQGDRCLSRSW